MFGLLGLQEFKEEEECFFDGCGEFSSELGDGPYDFRLEEDVGVCIGRESCNLCPCVHIVSPQWGGLAENLVCSCVGLVGCGAAVFVGCDGYGAGECC